MTERTHFRDVHPRNSPHASTKSRDRASHFSHSFGDINVFSRPVIQPKLVVSPPGDKYEREADRVAEQVMRMPEPQGQHKEMTIQAKSTLAVPQADPNFEAQVHSLRGRGQPFPKSERDFFESRFGHDFGQVRIHADTKSDKLARAAKARAFTCGRDVIFSSGEYAPGTIFGRRLLAHELTHVVQQTQKESHPIFTTSSRIAPLPTIQNTYFIQSERGGGERTTPTRQSVMIRGRQVKEHIRNRDSELYALIETNRFNGDFAQVRQETINGDQHIWQLSIRWDSYEFNPSGITRPQAPFSVGSRIYHRIQISVNPFRNDTPELRAQIPNVQERLESLAAETLFHELIHALILIESALPSGAAHTTMYLNFQRMLEVANSPLLREQKANVRIRLLALLEAAGVTNQPNIVDRHYENMINEKYANQTAASAFGRTRTNSRIARSYSIHEAEDIQRIGTVISNQTFLSLLIDNLRRDLYLLYERIDGEIVGPPSEIASIPEYIPATNLANVGLVESLE